MKTIEQLVKYLTSYDVIVDYQQKGETYLFSFYGDLYRHKDGFLQSKCTISTTDVDIALALMEIDSCSPEIAVISDISMMQRTFNIVSDSIKFDYDIEGIDVKSSTQFVK